MPNLRERHEMPDHRINAWIAVEHTVLPCPSNEHGTEVPCVLHIKFVMEDVNALNLVKLNAQTTRKGLLLLASDAVVRAARLQQQESKVLTF